jgi:hypothetical protein
METRLKVAELYLCGEHFISREVVGAHATEEWFSLRKE